MIGQNDRMQAYLDAMRSGDYMGAASIAMSVAAPVRKLRAAACGNGSCNCAEGYCALSEMFGNGPRSPEYGYA